MGSSCRGADLPTGMGGFGSNQKERAAPPVGRGQPGRRRMVGPEGDMIRREATDGWCNIKRNRIDAVAVQIDRDSGRRGGPYGERAGVESAAVLVAAASFLVLMTVVRCRVRVSIVAGVDQQPAAA